MQAHTAGRLKEVFGAGTAAVISPVGQIKYKDQVITINDDQTGPVAKKYYQAITGMQYGQTDDPMGWIETVS
jgi:branched-chain amino acid aminotransferase